MGDEEWWAEVGAGRVEVEEGHQRRRRLEAGEEVGAVVVVEEAGEVVVLRLLVLV